MKQDQVPMHLRETHARWSWALAYQLGPQVTTWRLTHPNRRTRFLKLRDARSSVRVRDECRRLRWARGHLPVPKVIDCGTDGDVDWLLTAGLPGVDATAEELRRDPGALVPLLARGLREFHRVAPTEACPFDFRLDAALAQVRSRVTQGLVNPAADFHPQHCHFTAASALDELLRLRPLTEDLVVCHGDYCLPNVLVRDGRITGYVDLGDLGVADRWWDLAVGAWSVTWNLGPGWEDLFYSSYGVEADPARISFFRLLYDLVS